MKKKKSILGSSKSYKNPEWLGATDKVEPMGPILGAPEKIPHPLDKKFMGDSKEFNFDSLLEDKLWESWGRVKRGKAGFLPYFIDDNGVVRFLFVMSSDPDYGGTRWMISKGHIDEGETPLQTALREGNEECGLKQSNLKSATIKIGWTGEITGMTDTSTMTIYIGEVSDPADFDKPGFEISGTKWLTEEEYYRIGRKSQINIVKSCAGKI